jgi:hypothetical protein
MLSAGRIPDRLGSGVFSALRISSRKYDEKDLIRRFDVDLNAPLRHKYAIGMLEMRGTFDPVPDHDYHAAGVRVGAHWCAIVSADVTYDLLEGLRLVSSSRGDAERLRSVLGDADRRASVLGRPAEFRAHAVVRWYDGAGNIRYRRGSHSQARISFETAVEAANAHSLDWRLPDLLSNFYRAQYEEIRQAEATEQDGRRLRTLVDDLTTERDSIAADVDAAQAQVQTNPMTRRSNCASSFVAIRASCTTVRWH